MIETSREYDVSKSTGCIPRNQYFYRRIEGGWVRKFLVKDRDILVSYNGSRLTVPIIRIKVVKPYRHYYAFVAQRKSSGLLNHVSRFRNSPGVLKS